MALIDEERCWDSLALRVGRVWPDSFGVSRIETGFRGSSLGLVWEIEGDLLSVAHACFGSCA